MSNKTQVKIALALVAGIALVVFLPTVQLLPATTRAWRRAKMLLSSVDWLARAARKLPRRVVATWVETPSRDSVPIGVDLITLNCAQLC